MKLCRLYHTVRYLKPIQLYRRLWFKCCKPKPASKPAPMLRDIKLVWQSSVQKPNSFSPPDQFVFLNKPSSLGEKDKNTKLWRYHFHYFDYLHTSHASDHVSALSHLIDQWILDNPAAKGDAWEPYPLSLRIVNWIKWHLSGNKLSEIALKSLANQVRYLTKRLEYHLLGNHLFANAKALFFAGLFFSGNEADAWFSVACKILSSQLPEQILKDGGHFELSPMYHAIILEDILDMINISNVYQKNSGLNFGDYAMRMLRWLKVMSHPDGDIAFFNDAALGVSPSFDLLQGYADRVLIKKNNPPQSPLVRGEGIDVNSPHVRGEGLDVDSSHVRGKGIDVNSSPDKGGSGGVSLFSLPASGYYRYDTNNYSTIIDAAAIGPDYLPGHAHADTLSFELSVGKQRVLVNSGISCYELSSERLRQRGTAAHNTVMLDQQNSSEVWSSFRVARRARIIQCNVQHDKLVAAHDGYQRLSGKPVHQRAWTFSDNGLTIKDSFLGKGQHDVFIYFHFHPDVSVVLEQSRLFVNSNKHERMLTLSIEGDVHAELQEDAFHSAFGLTQKNKVLCLNAHVKLPFEVAVRLVIEP